MKYKVMKRGIPVGVFTISYGYCLKLEFGGLPLAIVINMVSPGNQSPFLLSVVFSVADELLVVGCFGHSSGSPDQN